MSEEKQQVGKIVELSGESRRLRTPYLQGQALDTIDKLAKERGTLAVQVDQYKRDIIHLAYFAHKEHSQLRAMVYCPEKTCTFIREVQKKNE